MLTTNMDEKLQGIMESNALDDLPLKYLPPVSDEPENYYFVSYSHADYKAVYPDIFALQAQGVNIWYDRAMPAGKNWKETAEKYISPSRCAGVVFYLSENSLLSPAIHEEIAYAQKCGKSCLTVNLPMSDGKTRSAKEMLDALAANGVEVPDDKYNFISRAFGKDVIYLPYLSTAEHKAEKIFSLKKPPLLQFEELSDNLISVKSVNDIDVINVEETDFSRVDVKTENPIPVAAIGTCAFANCKKLEKVVLPYECRFIERYAFYGCNFLKKINLQDVLQIGEYAFCDCYNLYEIEMLNNGLNGINSCAFWNCGDISLTLPKRLRYIDDYAFGECRGEFVLPSAIEKIGKKVFSDDAKIIINEGEFYFVQDECLIERSTQKIICGNNRSSIPANDKITVIGDSAFMTSRITHIIIPDNITKIEDNVFYNCENLQSVKIADSVVEIGKYCFANCTSLENIVLGKGLTKIDDHTFSNCCRLQKVVIPDYIIMIERNAFYNCKSLESIWFGMNVVELCGSAFSFCENLKEILIPDNVTTIGDGCFDGCKSAYKIKLGKGLTKIGEYAFSHCETVTELVIPCGVKTIGAKCFNHCDKLKKVVYEGSVHEWQQIDKGSLWYGSGCIETVVCFDGEVKVQ